MARYFAIMLAMLILSGCHFLQTKEPSKEAIAYLNNFEIIGEEKERMLANIHPDILKSAIKEKESTEENFLYIDHKADRPYQVSSGRYEVSGKGTGYIYLYNEKNELIYREYKAYGIETIQLDIREDYDFRFNGLEEVSLIEIEPEITFTLTTGVWEVGTHIHPGVYEIQGEGFGYIYVFGEEDPRIFEIISSPFTHPEIAVEFSEGDQVIVSGLSKVRLHAID